MPTFSPAATCCRIVVICVAHDINLRRESQIMDAWWRA